MKTSAPSIVAAITASLLASGLAATPAPITEPPHSAQFRAFLQRACIQCHGPDKQKGDVRFDTLPFTNLTSEQIKVWQRAQEQVRDGEMPPDEDKKLSKEAKAGVDQFLAGLIAFNVARMPPSPAVLRRLNREQYRNTVRDLLGINVTVKDPTQAFPPDEIAEGFDNIGAALRTTDLHLSAYLDAAEQAMQLWDEQSTATPNSFHFQFPPKAGGKAADFGGETVQTDRYVDLLHGSWENRRFRAMTFPTAQTQRQLLARDGVYRITVDAEAIHTSDPEGLKLAALVEKVAGVLSQPSAKLNPQFSFYLDRSSRAISPAIHQRLITFDLQHNERKTFSAELWLPGGTYTLTTNFDTGTTMDVHIAAAFHACLAELGGDPRKIEPEELRMFESLRADGLSGFRSQVMERTARVRKDVQFRESEMRRWADSLPLPRIRFHAITIDGPLPHAQGAEPAYFAAAKTVTDAERRELHKFATRAFRRPVDAAELAPYVRYAEKNSYRNALKAMLCSPHFLYLREPEGLLDPYSLASRLSYFLWNSMPDDELLRLAGSGRLKDENEWRRQFDRMLASPKAASFYERFVHQWLGFANMKAMPAAKDFRYFHDYFIKDLMQQESIEFFKHLLATNAPVSALVNADYSFMNSALAGHYGGGYPVKGSAFERVSLAATPERRGLLGQGAILTTSANGIDTSPVVRGIWVLEHLLGTPPSPPPPNIPPLEPDTRGTKSMKEMLAAHRNDASCNRCHKDIDPLGFALENFDPVGRWRERYENGKAIDSSGTLPNGAVFQDIKGLRSALGDASTKLIAHNLTHRLLACAVGRKLNAADDRIAAAILEKHRPRAYPVKDLIYAVTTSEAFRKK